MTYRRLLTRPRQSFFLFGARGTGKTTWVREMFPDATFIDMLDEGVYQAHLADPTLLASRLRAQPAGSWVVIDEVQRIPSMLNEVHRFIESRRLKFALCGSSARKLKREGTNLLAGRALRRSLYPFLPEELGSRFDLDDALRFGTMPVTLEAEDREGALEAYAQLYLKEEIQAEAIVRNLPGFARFLPIAALFHGQAINTASLARDAGVSRTTVAGFIDILEDTHMAFRVPAFEARLRVRERRHPKLYWTDSGIVRAVKKQLGPPSVEERGALFEGLIANLLRAYRDYRALFDEIYYWAPVDAAATEVDFLIDRGPALIAIEVKSTRRPDRLPSRGLRSIRELKGLRRRILVFAGEGRYRTEDGIDQLGFREFLDEVETGSLWARS